MQQVPKLLHILQGSMLQHRTQEASGSNKQTRSFHHLHGSMRATKTKTIIEWKRATTLRLKR